jgi:hypothetical protein
LRTFEGMPAMLGVCDGEQDSGATISPLLVKVPTLFNKYSVELSESDILIHNGT